MTDERTAAMDAMIAESADMIDVPAMGEVERVAKALANADGLDWDEVCGVDADPDEGYCDSGTCVAAHWEEHDAEQARRWYMHLATAALSAMSPAGEVERLREALTPSEHTEAAYVGGFKFMTCTNDADSDGEEYPLEVYVPWTTIKEIMAAIHARAIREHKP